MWARSTAALLATLPVIAAPLGCSDNDCTDGCEDAFVLTVKTKDNTLPRGEYTLDVSLDGDEIHCAYSRTGEPETDSGYSYIDCDWRVSIVVHPTIECTQAMEGSSTSTSCNEVPGLFTRVVTFRGTPRRVDVTERRDGVLLGERSFAPQYETHDDSCGGSCTGDSQEWTLE
ncbi:hypothetical protein [Sorangium sp. So ce1000]|uniref:hypothetical protein n=1 Tax=Sorangium sp. So ce1000 TaxID=3133325 RepID=UPI003F64393B